jgi:P27 family predicted phage terminase small subunit
MAGSRQPIELLVLKGKKNLTKKEIKERKAKEVKAPADKVRAPSYLPSELKKEFNKIAKELVRIEIMTNLDIDALARFVLSKKMYLDVTTELLNLKPTSKVYADLLISQDKLFKQSRVAASDLGLTISSRCKLVMPKKEVKKELSPEERLFGEV